MTSRNRSPAGPNEHPSLPRRAPCARRIVRMTATIAHATHVQRSRFDVPTPGTVFSDRALNPSGKRQTQRPALAVSDPSLVVFPPAVALASWLSEHDAGLHAAVGRRRGGSMRTASVCLRQTSPGWSRPIRPRASRTRAAARRPLALPRSGSAPRLPTTATPAWHRGPRPSIRARRSPG